MARVTDSFIVEFCEDGTFNVMTCPPFPPRDITRDRKATWLADMEQRIAQARSHT